MLLGNNVISLFIITISVIHKKEEVQMFVSKFLREYYTVAWGASHLKMLLRSLVLFSYCSLSILLHRWKQLVLAMELDFTWWLLLLHDFIHSLELDHWMWVLFHSCYANSYGQYAFNIWKCLILACYAEWVECHVSIANLSLII